MCYWKFWNYVIILNSWHIYKSQPTFTLEKFFFWKLVLAKQVSKYCLFRVITVSMRVGHCAFFLFFFFMLTQPKQLNMPFFNNIITIMVTYLMISKNIAQKHMSTAKTDRMLENSATDTSIAVTATNIVAIRTTDYSSYRPLDVG